MLMETAALSNYTTQKRPEKQTFIFICVDVVVVVSLVVCPLIPRCTEPALSQEAKKKTLSAMIIYDPVMIICTVTKMIVCHLKPVKPPDEAQ